MVAKDFRHSAWRSLSGKWGTCVLICFVLEIISATLAGLSYVGIGAVAILIVMGPLYVGYYKMALDVARDKEVEFGVLFSGFNDFSRSLVLYLTNYLFVALWSLLLIVPGIIKSYAYSMSYYIILDNPDISANDARKRSIEMMRGNKWRLFCLDLSFIGWALLSVLTCGILLFWISPYLEVARAKFYLSLLPKEEQNYSAVNDGNYNPDYSKNDFDAFDDNANVNEEAKNDFEFSDDDNIKM